jgi:hypothetical protein
MLSLLSRTHRGVEPVRHRRLPAVVTAGLLGQNEEGRLKGVLGILQVRQDTAADAQDHASVAAEQPCEGGLIVVIAKAAEEIRVADAASVQRSRFGFASSSTKATEIGPP